MNPYSAPTDREAARVPDQTPLVWLSDGTLLVEKHQSNLRLPEVCWATGSTERLSPRTITLRRSTIASITCQGVAILGPVYGVLSEQLGIGAKVPGGIGQVTLNPQLLNALALMFVIGLGILGMLLLMERVNVTLFESPGLSRWQKRKLKIRLRSRGAAVIGFTDEFHLARKRLHADEAVGPS